MTVLQAIILGIVQGLTEFLPVSSSGHLAITQLLLRIPEDRIFFLTVMLHVGTLFSVMVVYWTDLTHIVIEFIKMCADLINKKSAGLENEYRRLGVFIIVGTIPTGIMGLLLKDVFAAFYTSRLVIGFSLIITGSLLWFAERSQRMKTSELKPLSRMSWKNALTVGVFQGFAITPGISRSGSTIAGALLQGINKETATRFSFLLSFPAILAATLLETKEAMAYGMGDVTFPALMAGIAASFVAGIFAIRSLINLIKKERLFYFAFYTWAAGTAVILSILLGF
jgi:undecaprenyl-diphosphatase